MTRLVLLGGPTGVGKSTALKALKHRLPQCATLDADDVWQVSPSLAVPENRGRAIDNVTSVLHGYLDAGCQTAVVAWVFARPLLYQPVIEAVGDRVDEVCQLYLTASPEALQQRLINRGEEDRWAYALSRLELVNALDFDRLDTTDMAPDTIVDWLCDRLQRPA